MLGSIDFHLYDKIKAPMATHPRFSWWMQAEVTHPKCVERIPDIWMSTEDRPLFPFKNIWKWAYLEIEFPEEIEFPGDI